MPDILTFKGLQAEIFIFVAHSINNTTVVKDNEKFLFKLLFFCKKKSGMAVVGPETEIITTLNKTG
jgi:hypothetical protein